MKVSLAVTALLGLTAVSEAAAAVRRSPFTRTLNRRQFGGGFGGGFNNDHNDDNDDNNNGNNGNNGGGSTTLSDNAIQTGSASDGQADQEAGQSPSAT